MQPDEVFFTDKQLRDRWHCSHMKLWRMRQRGLLASIRVGGSGHYLTPAAIVVELEAGEEITRQGGPS